PVREAMAHCGTGRRNDAGAVPVADDDARHHHGFLRIDYGAAERIRELLPANSDRRGGHGVSGPEYDVVLDYFRGAGGDAGRVLRQGRCTTGRLDGLSAVERGRGDLRTRRRPGPD